MQCYSIENEQAAETPISDLLYGNFIELGFGAQVESMWEEMFFNRSFERLPPYKEVNVTWFNLWKDPADHAKGYYTDWRQFDWYHSGYEHNAWFAAPGKDEDFHIDEDSTFIIRRSRTGEARITQIPGGVHGDYCLRIENRGGHEKGGLGQEGKYFTKGKEYHFSGYFWNIKGAGCVKASFYPEGDWQEPITSVEIWGIGSDFTYREFSIRSEITGRVTFALWIPGQSVIDVDAFSLAPADTTDGWRREVVEEAGKLNTSVLRWLGGCFASFYNWKNAIGPRNCRKPEPSYFLGGMELQ